tara:strand:- start:631 stop:783 length:153 start_codon:yes stop_codon:yes gene_type:complete
MIYNLGIPYMGSKRKLAPKILNKIMQDNPSTLSATASNEVEEKLYCNRMN